MKKIKDREDKKNGKHNIWINWKYIE